MNFRPQHILIFLATGWLLTSCETADEDTVQGSEVTFVVSDLSRASATTLTNIIDKDPQFAIYGDMKFRDNAPINIFDNTIVRYSNGKWSYDEPQYWFPIHEHSFIAMHPVAATGVSGTQYSDSRLSFSYTLPDDYTKVNDLIVATHRRKIEANPPYKVAPIALKFWHIMSRVDFQLTNDGAADIVKVSEIKLDGIDRTGSFTVIPAPLSSGNQTDDYDFSWTGISNRGDLTAEIKVNVPEDETRSLFPDNNALFMVPQPDNTDIIMHITYTRYDDGNDDEEHTLTATAPIGGWEPGKVYTYSLTVSEVTKDIYLTVSVKNWQTPTSTGITVPES